MRECSSELKGAAPVRRSHLSSAPSTPLPRGDIFPGSGNIFSGTRANPMGCWCLVRECGWAVCLCGSVGESAGVPVWMGGEWVRMGGVPVRMGRVRLQVRVWPASW